MSMKYTQKNQVGTQSGTISDLSLRLKQAQARREKRIRVKISKHFRRPSNFTAHFLLFILMLVSLATVLAFLSDRGENTNFVPISKSLISKQKAYEKDFNSSGFTIKNPNIILDPYKNSPLTALIIFETEEEVSPTVTILGKITLSHQFPKSKKHFLPIYGLYPDTENNIKISYEDSLKKEKANNLNASSTESSSNILDEKNTTEQTQNFNPNLDSLVATIDRYFTIKTAPVPNDLPKASIKQIDKTQLNSDRSGNSDNSDFYFFSPSTKNGRMVAYDQNGDIRWYLTNTALWNNIKLNNGHLLVSTERLINPPYYSTGLYEIDMLGKIYTEYSLPGGYHHDYFELPNNNLLVASNNFTNNSTVEDVVVELDRKTGKIVKQIDLKKLLNTSDGKSENWSNYDWFHNNSVYYDQKTNSIILSGRHQDAVVSLDYETGRINWILGDPTHWSENYQKFFLKPIGNNFEYQWSQHAAKLTPEGYLFLFDNGNNKSKNLKDYTPAKSSYSRGVLYKINTTSMTVEQLWQYGKERGSDFYSPYISDVDYLEKDHYLVHSGGIVKSNGEPSNQPAGLTAGNVTLFSDTVEIKNNRVIFELLSPTNNYRVEKMNIYAGTNFTINSAKHLGTLGKTEINDKKQGFITDTDVDQSFLEKHEIEITNEEDRIIISGRFKREDQVRIGLYRNFNTNLYKFPISKRPYTALCVDVFSETESQDGIVVKKYINKEGLKGNYSIYIEQNSRLYNTGKYVNF